MGLCNTHTKYWLCKICWFVGKTRTEQGMIKNRQIQRSSVDTELNDSLSISPTSSSTRERKKKSTLSPKIFILFAQEINHCYIFFSSAPVLLNGFGFLSQCHGCSGCLSHGQSRTRMDCNGKDGEKRKVFCILVLREVFFLLAAPAGER